MSALPPHKKEVLETLFKRHLNAVFVVSTGFLSRSVFEMYPKHKNIFYMKGSMGLAPAIGLGMAASSNKDIVVISGDGALLMHLGITHTINELQLPNFFLYVLDNGCHESVGGFKCSKLEDNYAGVTKVIKVQKDKKPARISLDFQTNSHDVKAYFQQ